MNKKTLKEKKSVLEQQKIQTEYTFQKIIGAIEFCDSLLAEIEKQEDRGNKNGKKKEK